MTRDEAIEKVRAHLLGEMHATGLEEAFGELSDEDADVLGWAWERWGDRIHALRVSARGR